LEGFFQDYAVGGVRRRCRNPDETTLLNDRGITALLPNDRQRYLMALGRAGTAADLRSGSALTIM